MKIELRKQSRKYKVYLSYNKEIEDYSGKKLNKYMFSIPKEDFYYADWELEEGILPPEHPDSAESYVISTYGNIFSNKLSEVIKENDDLFTRINIENTSSSTDEDEHLDPNDHDFDLLKKKVYIFELFKKKVLIFTKKVNAERSL